MYVYSIYVGKLFYIHANAQVVYCSVECLRLVFITTEKSYELKC